MNPPKFPCLFSVLTLTLPISLIIPVGMASAIPETPALLAQAVARATQRNAVKFNLPNRGAPRISFGLGRRGEGDCIANSSDRLIALLPSASSELDAQNLSPVGLTTSTHPTLFVYIPSLQESAQYLSLRVMQRTATGEEVEFYSQDFPLPLAGAGVMGLTPDASTMPPLDTHQHYRWYVSVVCDSIDQSGNAVVDGWVERVEPDFALAQQLTHSDSLQRAMLLGEAGIWQDTLLAMAQQQQQHPQDANAQITWQDLLRSVGLDAIAEAPLLQCCTPSAQPER
ncbi:DUF928 domain-containing protein [bacterium]|nr:DUF928 domain-containing protein [bacterium]